MKIVLSRIEPPIWRRILVDPGIKLSDFHKVLQTVMGWANCDLHSFGKGTISIWHPEELELIPTEITFLDSRKIALKTLLSFEGHTLKYFYHFEDEWELEIVLEDILGEGMAQECPVCLGGERASPPEDVGSVPGYYNMLEVIRNPGNEYYERMRDWLPLYYDPEEFDLALVNVKLRDPDFGCWH